MRRVAALALLVAFVACSRPERTAPDAGAPAVASSAPAVQEVVLDELRVRPCPMKQKGDDVDAAIACAREWGEGTLKDHLPDPKWICANDNAYQVYFESLPTNKAAPFAIALIYKPFMTIEQREYHELIDVPKAPKCTERRPSATKPAAPETLTLPPVAEAVRVASELVKGNVFLLPGNPGNAKPVGQCGMTTPTPKCESLGHARWILFSSPPEVTFFVRVDGSLNARFDEAFPFATPVGNPAPWSECGCEALPGYDVHLRRLVKPF